MVTMPTPFMHLRAAYRFLNDPAVPASIRAELGSSENLGAFLLGHVAPDARVSGGLSRDSTHFFAYQPVVNPDAGDAMLAEYPALKNATGAQRAFIAGYLAHLRMDVIWCEVMLFPNFYQKEWGGDPETRYNMLHVLLCYLDEQDYRQWSSDFAPALRDAQPHGWLPFLSDTDLQAWQQIVARQICEGCESETLAVLGKRVRIKEAGLRALLSDPLQMQTNLWDHVSQAIVADVEARMYSAMVAWIIRYTTEMGS